MPPEAAATPIAPGRVLLGAEIIARRVEELGAEIAVAYQGRELTVVALYNGAVFFAADLLRHLPGAVRFEALCVASYEGTGSTGTIRFRQEPLPDLAGRDVLLVDDILDTGQTLRAVCQRLQAETAPATLRTAVLLHKQRATAAGLRADWTGFEIGDEFVIGYGLDFNGLYRNLPYIALAK